MELVELQEVRVEEEHGPVQPTPVSPAYSGRPGTGQGRTGPVGVSPGCGWKTLGVEVPRRE